MAQVNIPALLREYVGGAETVDVSIPEGERLSVRDVVRKLDEQHPGIWDNLVHEGEIVPGIAVFVNNEQAMLGLSTKVQDQDMIHFIPPVVGG